MKVAVINSVDVGSGAANACFRLVEALRSNGVDAAYIVQKQKGTETKFITPILKNKIHKIPYFLKKTYENLKLKRHSNSFNFSLPLGGNDLTKLKEVQNADAINVHWFNDCFLSLNDIKQLASLGKPLLFTLHDMWLFTGGCHYSGNCDRYITHCHTCPVLQSEKYQDISFKQFEKKISKLENLNFKLITPSKWMANIARTSYLLKSKHISAIPNCIDIQTFKPLNKSNAKARLNLDDDKFNLLFGAVKSTLDIRKGYIHLISALRIIHERSPQLSKKIRLLIFGANQDEINIDLPFEIKVLGKLSKEEIIIQSFNAADAFVIPSLEDNLPNTIMEAMACGLPCVGFNIGGIPEMIDHLQNGFLASAMNDEELAQGIIWVIENSKYIEISKNARQKVVDEYNYSKVASSYVKMYSS